MATSTVKLVLEFKDAGGNDRKWSFNNADVDVTAAKVKELAQAMVTNGSIYAHSPVEIVGAQFVITSTDEIDIISD